MGLLALYVILVISSYFVCNPFSVILLYVSNRQFLIMWMSGGNYPVIRFLNACVYLVSTAYCTKDIKVLCNRIYVWCSQRATLFWILEIAIRYCVISESMTSAPRIGDGTNGVVGVTVVYWAALICIPKYPLTPPPRLHGTTVVLEFNWRAISCSLSKDGLPMNFVRPLSQSAVRLNWCLMCSSWVLSVGYFLILRCLSYLALHCALH